ncbi:MAG: class I SAM-dependent methyltransferase [Rickettsiales bacterium]
MSIPCIICASATQPFMQKHFEQFNLGDVYYDKCDGCGFVFSRTHYEMTDAEWETLNNQWVSLYQGTDDNPEDPRWLERFVAQSAIIGDCANLGLLPKGRWLDYGAGDGKLVNALAVDHGLKVEKYEHSSNPAQGYLQAGELKPKAFSLVTHTAVMEHLRFRSQLDGIFDLVSDEGVMILHTLVAEHVPQNPDWFYLLSVHCSFFTNRSMQLLFEQNGYQCSVYNVASRLWLWSKQPASIIRPIIEKANAMNRDSMYQYIFAEKFVDYWK